MSTPGIDVIRSAAELLRTAGTRAVHGHTSWRQGHTRGTKSPVVLDHPDRPTVLIETHAVRYEDVNAYLELVGPDTGLALAQWFDVVIKNYAMEDDQPECPDCGNGCPGHGTDTFHVDCGNSISECQCLADPAMVAFAVVGDRKP